MSNNVLFLAERAMIKGMESERKGSLGSRKSLPRILTDPYSLWYVVLHTIAHAIAPPKLSPGRPMKCLTYGVVWMRLND